MLQGRRFLYTKDFEFNMNDVTFYNYEQEIYDQLKITFK